MKESLENNSGLSKYPFEINYNTLHNLTIKQVQFNGQNNQRMLVSRNLKPTLPTKIVHNGQYKADIRYKKMLPGLKFKPINITKGQNKQKNGSLEPKNICGGLRNARNSDILNQMIQILKTDPDKSQMPYRLKNIIRTEPSCQNQFIEPRQIFSVKNSRMPKIISNQIMMLSRQRRNLVSQQKRRPKMYGEQPNILGNQLKKIDPFDEMQMTFYKPVKINQKEYRSSTAKKSFQNQFIDN